MKKFLFVITMLCIFASSSTAKPCVKRWPFWVGEGVIGGSIAADDASTAVASKNLTEGNGFLGAHPSNKQIAALGVLNFAGQSLLNLAACHVAHHVPVAASCTYYNDRAGVTHEHCTEFMDDRLGWRIVGYVGIPTEQVIISGIFGAKHNIDLETAHRNALRYTPKP